MRSSSGPLSRRRWRARSASVQRQRRVPAYPQGHGFVAGDEHEPRREQRRALAAHDRDAARPRAAGAAPRAPARELRQLVEEEHAVVGEGRLARARAPRRRRRGPTREIVWCGARNGRSRDEPAPAWRPATLWMRVTSIASSRRQRRQDRRQPPREHRLAGARRPGRAAGCAPPAAAIAARGSARRGRGRRRGPARLGGGGAAGRGRPAAPAASLAAQDRARPRRGRRRRATSSPSTSAASRAHSRGDDEPVEAARAPRPRRPRARRGTAQLAAERQLAEDGRAARAPRRAAARSRRGRRTAIARSKPGPALRRWAGARLTMMRRCGNSKPEFASAARTRSRASRTARVAEPDDRERRQAGAEVDLDGDPPRRRGRRSRMCVTRASIGRDARRGLRDGSHAAVTTAQRASRSREPRSVHDRCAEHDRGCIGTRPRLASPAMARSPSRSSAALGEQLALEHLERLGYALVAPTTVPASASSTSSSATARRSSSCEVKTRRAGAGAGRHWSGLAPASSARCGAWRAAWLAETRRPPTRERAALRRDRRHDRRARPPRALEHLEGGVLTCADAPALTPHVRARAAGTPWTGTTCGAAARRPGAGSRRGAPASNSRRARRTPSPGWRSSARCMKRSRVTLATIEAAAIAALVASPSTIGALLEPKVADREAVGEAEQPRPGHSQQRLAQRGEVRAVQPARVDPATQRETTATFGRRPQHDRVQRLRPRRSAAWSR